MAWAQEMKNLAAEIKTSHRDRTKYVEDVKNDTYELIARFQGELKEMARDLKDFLAKSETDRKKDFNALYKAIQAQIRDIKGGVKDFLSKSEEKRMADFKVLMKDVTGAVEAIQRTTKALLGDYAAERKEAAGYWARLKGKEAAVIEEAEEKTPKPRRGGRKKK